MSFLNPILLAAGLACVAIPIVIHLLMRRRRRPVRWGAMRFLIEAYRQNRRRLRLEQLLLLAARCLLIALIAVALGRPLLGAGSPLGGRGSVAIYLLIDNSLTAGAQDADRASALARHKRTGTDLLAQLDAAIGDRGALVALAGPALPVVLPASSDIGSLREQVGELALASSAADLEGALSLVRDQIGEGAPGSAGGRTLVVILSEFLGGSADLERRLPDLGPDVSVLASLPAERAVGNISITGVEPLRPLILARPQPGTPASQIPVRVRVQRWGPIVAEPGVSAVDVSLHDWSGGRAEPGIAARAIVRWQPGQTEAIATASVEMVEARGGGEGDAVLSAAVDADALPGDNVWRRTVEVRRSLRIGLISSRRAGPGVLAAFEPADWFRLALTPERTDEFDRAAELEVIDFDPAAIDPARLAGLDAVILPEPQMLGEQAWRRMRDFADAGGLVLVSAPVGVGVHTWTDEMVRAMGLAWTVSREPLAPERGELEHPPPAPGGEGLLSMIEPELADLLRPVRVWRILDVQAEPGAGERILGLQNGPALVLAARPGSANAPARRGLLVLLGAAPAFEWTDLPAKPLMVPLVQELIRQGVGRARGSAGTIAGAHADLPAGGVELRRLSDGPQREAVLGAGKEGQTAAPIRHAGIFRALDERGAGRGIVAVNHDPRAGRTDAQSPAQVGAWLAAVSPDVRWLGSGDGAAGERLVDVHGALSGVQESGRLVLAILLAALALGVAEMAMARWFSHATIGGGGSGGGGA